MVALPKRKEHPFKVPLRRKRIRHWQLAQLTGFSQPTISNWLNGIVEMPTHIEDLIRPLVEDAGR